MKLSWQIEIEALARAHGVTLADIKSPSRRSHLVLARREMWALLRKRGWSFPRIGAEFNRHHSTIMYALGACASKGPAR